MDDRRSPLAVITESGLSAGSSPNIPCQGLCSVGHLLSPHRVRRKNGVDRCAGAVVAIRPKMGIGVERLTRRRMARPGLNSLDRLTVADFAATRKSAATRET